MKLRLRQIALAVTDLEVATLQASQILGLGSAYQDPAIVRYGLRNAVYAIDNTFLEFVSPITENTTVGRLLAKQGGDCGYMVILQTDGADEARARIDAAGVRVADQLDRNGAGFMRSTPTACRIWDGPAMQAALAITASIFKMQILNRTNCMPRPSACKRGTSLAQK